MQRDEQRGALGDRFESFGAEPSSGLWDSIANSLDQKKKRKGIIWWWIGSGIAAIGIIFILLINPTQTNVDGLRAGARLKANHENEKPNTTANETTLSKKLASSKLMDRDLVIDENNRSNLSKNKEVDSKLTPKKQPDDLSPNPPVKKEIALINEVAIDKQKVEKVSKLPLADVEELFVAKANQNLMIGDVPELNQQKWELGFGVNSWMVSNRLLSAVNEQNNFSELIVDSGAGTAGFTIEASDLYAKANRPLGFNFYAGYRVRPNLRITSGLNYETTNYSIRTIENEVYDAGAFQVYNELTADQNKYYRPTKITSISLPIGLDWDFFGTRRMRFGTGLSILNEFPIMEQSLSVSGLSFDGGTTPTKARISGYHFGTGLNLIATYFLTERCRVQLNPGVRGYWFQKTNASDLIPHRRLWYGGSVNLIWNI
jgi:hypothetical protein